eukprot:2133380-Karenia_brevis.AAC.1
MGVIVALLSPLSIHIALDNENVVKHALDFKRILLHDESPGLFSQIIDGDLWKLFYHILHMRGPSSFHATWTKGHAFATLGYLDAHPHLRAQAYHNDYVDRLAEDAYAASYDKNMIDLSNMLYTRHHQYVDFVKQVHLIIARVHIASQNLLKTPAFQLAHPELN